MRNLAVSCAVVTLMIAFGDNSGFSAEPCPGKGMRKLGTIVATAKSARLFCWQHWGGGELTLNDGKKYNFCFKGLKVLDADVAVTDFVGDVYNLNKIDDFVGVYHGTSANIELVKAKGEVIVKNKKCVVVKVRPTKMGIRLSPPSSAGVYVQLVK